MSRPLTVFLPVIADDVATLDQALRRDPGMWLPGAESAGPERWRMTLRLGPLQRDVACEVGPLRDTGGSVWRDLRWEPVPQDGDRLPVHESLPSFEGELGLHAARAVLVLDGDYEVPGGRIGEIADAMALSGAARSTASRLLADIVRGATAQVPVDGTR